MVAEHAVEHASEQDSASVVSATALLTGVVIGLILCVLNIIVAFKTGASFGGSALVALMGAGILRALGRLSWPRLFIVFSVASSGYLAVAAFDSAVAAMYFSTGKIPATWVLMAAATGANICGIGLGTVLAGLFVRREALPYPTLRPAITLMLDLVSRRGKSMGTLAVAAVAAAAVAGVADATGHGTLPLYPGAPGYAALAVSPLLVGTGALVGWRTGAWILAGTAFSVAVWATGSHHAVPSYTAHLTSMWILPVGVGVIVGYSLATLARSQPQLRAGLSGALRPRAARAAVAGCALLLAGSAATVLAVWGWPAARWLLAGGLALVATCVFALFLCRAGGEVGIAPLSPVLYLSVIVFTLVAGSSAALLIAATVSCTGIAAVYYTYAEKVAASEPGGQRRIRRRHVLGSQLAGGIAGALAGVGAIVAVIRSGALRGQSFPAPLAESVSFMTHAAGQRSMADLPVALAAVAGGALLTFTPAIPTSLGLGILLPPAYALALALGGAGQWLALRGHPERKQAVDSAAAGLVIGEGVIVMCVLVLRAV
jgi:hypothetical protein